MNNSADEFNSDVPDSNQGGSRLLLLLNIMALASVAIANLLGLFGNTHWIFDLANCPRVQYLIVCLAALSLSLMTWRPKLAIVAFVLLLLNAIPVANYYRPYGGGETTTQNPSSSVRFLTFNVLSSNSNYDEVITWIQDQTPDVIAILEVNQDWADELERLSAEYPYFKIEPRNSNFGLAMFSRIPCESIEVLEGDGQHYPMIKARINTQDGPTTLVATHPCPPLNSTRYRSRRTNLENALQALGSDGPRILTGDFNLVPWSPLFSELCDKGELHDASLGFGVRPTWHLFPSLLGGIRIDHLLTSNSIRTQSFSIGPNMGSDHRPIIFDLRIGADLGQ